MSKVNNIIKLASYYSENIYRNRDRVKSKVNWWKTKWGVRDDWQRK